MVKGGCPRREQTHTSPGHYTRLRIKLTDVELVRGSQGLSRGRKGGIHLHIHTRTPNTGEEGCGTKQGEGLRQGLQGVAFGAQFRSLDQEAVGRGQLYPSGSSPRRDGECRSSRSRRQGGRCGDRPDERC
jgi:hypothetical protein